MEPGRFDTIARLWATTTSRRRLLGGLLTAALVGAIGRFRTGAGRQDWPAAADAADAACAAKADPEYETQCRYLPCGESGSCVVTTDGAWRCVGGGVHCPARDECERDEDCGPDQVCARLGGCCVEGHDARRQCLPRYGAPVTTPPPPTPTLTPDERPAAQAAADAACAADLGTDPDPEYGDRCLFRPCPDGMCVVSAVGGWRCVDPILYPTQPRRCPPQDQCRRDSDCRRGRACVRLGKCCADPGRTVCLRKSHDAPPIVPVMPGAGGATPTAPGKAASPTP